MKKRIRIRLNAGDSDAVPVRGWYNGNILDDRGTSVTGHRFDPRRTLSTDGYNEHR